MVEYFSFRFVYLWKELVQLSSSSRIRVVKRTVDNPLGKANCGVEITVVDLI